MLDLFLMANVKCKGNRHRFGRLLPRSGHNEASG